VSADAHAALVCYPQTKVRAWILALSIFALGPRHGEAVAGSCRPSELTAADARKLVLLSPEAFYARRNGASLYALAWAPPNGDAKHFYFEQIDKLGTKAGDETVGHFAVNRASGEVINVDTSTREHGEKLMSLQRSLRRSHCISDEIVQAERERPMLAGESAKP
jgi:hypothetical protein